MWWITHNQLGVLMARGVQGQPVYMDPKPEWSWPVLLGIPWLGMRQLTEQFAPLPGGG